jgi:hypothetical protein
MKHSNATHRILLILGLSLLFGLYASSFGNSGIALNLMSDVQSSRVNTAFVQSGASNPVNEAASPSKDETKKEHLPGSRIKDEDAIKKASLIIVGKIVDPGGRSFDFPSETHHGGVKVEVLQILKGDVSGELSLDFVVQDYPRETAERAPEVGQQYIIFLKKKSYTGIKFLPYTEEQRRHIVDLVSSTANEQR